MKDRIRVPRIAFVVESEEAVRARGSRRLRWLSTLLLVLLAGVGLRNVQLALVPSDRTLRAAAVQRWNTVTLEARRGEVLDRDGHRLATSMATPRVVADPFHIAEEEVPGLANTLSHILAQPNVDAISARLTRKGRWSQLAKRVHPAAAAQVEAMDHPGVWVDRPLRRYYPEEGLGAHILGFVDGDGEGKAGVEATFDRDLRGSAVLLQRRRDRHGLSVDDPARAAQPNVGMNVILTMDRAIQHVLEQALADALERSEPRSATAVVVDVRTGDLLAMASAPTFNPNRLDERHERRRNRAVQDAVEPGSVLKPFTFAAAIEEGLITPDSPIDCENGAWRVGGEVIHDDTPHRVLSAAEALQHSSNIGSAKLALELGSVRFLAYVDAFGFGKKTGIRLPGERAGVVRSPDRVRTIELATTSYGQGITTTALQLAMATAALGNDGLLMKPRLVSRIEDVHGVPEAVIEPTAVGRVVSRATARQVVDMMVGVTAPDGHAPLGAVPGYTVAGKTGTAQKVVDGRYGEARLASFVAIAPADNPYIAVAVLVDEPSKGSHYGNQVAAPVAAEIIEGALRHLGVPPAGAARGPLVGDLPAWPAALRKRGLVKAAAGARDLHLAWTGEGWRMPDLHGRLLRETVQTLTLADIGVDASGSGRIVEQRPTPGATLRPGDRVSVILR
ncbi:MAG: transpeptidase family protein [Myxococcales bacterium]|nr:transpeptidase family protein [Myxococcales bacterium]